MRGERGPGTELCVWGKRTRSDLCQIVMRQRRAARSKRRAANKESMEISVADDGVGAQSMATRKRIVGSLCGDGVRVGQSIFDAGRSANLIVWAGAGDPGAGPWCGACWGESVVLEFGRFMFR